MGIASWADDGTPEDARLEALRDRLDVSEEKQVRLYGRLLEARERIVRLEEDNALLRDALSEACEHSASLMAEVRLLRMRLASARMRLARLSGDADQDVAATGSQLVARR
jgi:chromosome segregation ATPase